MPVPSISPFGIMFFILRKTLLQWRKFSCLQMFINWTGLQICRMVKGYKSELCDKELTLYHATKLKVHVFTDDIFHESQMMELVFDKI